MCIRDSISLDPGRLRIRRKGSDGGHNGLKSIIYQLRSDAFPRIKLGVGAKPHPDYNLADWVLGKFPEKERPAVGEAIDRACEAAELIVADKIDEAMNRFNSLSLIHISRGDRQRRRHRDAVELHV